MLTALLLSSLLLPIALLWAIPLFAWVIYQIAAGRFAFSGLLQKPLVVYGSKVSYSLYLSHGAMLMFFGVLAPVSLFIESTIATKLVYVCAYLACSLGIAIVFYHCIEEPCRKYMVNKVTTSQAMV